MPHIVLTDEQARVISESTEPVDVFDPSGRILNFLKPLDPVLAETILECKRRLATSDSRIPSEDVQAHLRKLEEVRQREGMDREKMLQLLRQLRAGEPV
jgi:hypothetical protein